ncbi:MAG: sigma-70 family RNA polymerase sigma factor [Nitrospinae bacterium]|nr:sigma-70 family RNA polymerase sigma factor [Nitrospinota bacterium]
MSPDRELELEEDVERRDRLPVPAPKGEKKALAPLDPFAAYLNEIRRYGELDAKEEFDLAVKYRKEGDPAAAYRLITANLMLVVRTAMTFRREWQNLMDLIQEGNVGLMKAVKNFDPFRGVRLPAYALWWVKAYILKYLLDNWRLVKVGTTNTRRKLLYNLRKEKENLERQGFAPSSKLLAEHFGVDEQEVIDVEAGLGAADVSVDAPMGGDGAMTPLHALSDGAHPARDVEEEQFRRLVRENIDRFAAGLKPVERDILECRVLADKAQPLKEIGDKYGVTREAVRQTERRLMKKLKGHIVKNMPEAADYFKQ